jgi:hypothetical protein
MNYVSTQWFDVRGTRYYDAKALVNEGRLRAGTLLQLKHQPDNPHDGNAVQVIEMFTGRMIGHIPREHAGVVGTRLRQGQITHVDVGSVETMRRYPKIRIRVTYSFPECDSRSPGQPKSDDTRPIPEMQTSTASTESEHASAILVFMVLVTLAIAYCHR